MVVSAGGGGFKHSKTYLLEWPEGHEYHGLKIRTRGVSTGTMIDITTVDDEDPNSLAFIFEQFASVLTWWNMVDDDDQPVPATLEGVRSIDYRMGQAIVRAWQRTVTGVSDPKEPPSIGGLPLVEASLPMETSSASLAI